jgi:hypothetical protein
LKSIAFTGSRIEVRGERWGVLLLDSQKDGHIIERGTKKKLLDEYTVLISSVLSKLET